MRPCLSSSLARPVSRIHPILFYSLLSTMAAAVHHHSPGSSVGQATARRMSRNPQAQQQAKARGEAESAAAGGGWGEDVVPQLKRRAFTFSLSLSLSAMKGYGWVQAGGEE